MALGLPEINFSKVRAIGSGGCREGFEQLLCILAERDEEAPSGSSFQRFEGAGGDGGVEAIHILPGGDKWGWQSKYVSDFDKSKSQLDSSVDSALHNHPELVRYIFAFPFDLTGNKRGKGKSQVEKFDEWKKGWESTAKQKLGRNVAFSFLGATQLEQRLHAVDKTGALTRYYFDKTLLSEDWRSNRTEQAIAASRPRYVPQLNINVPVYQGFHAIVSDDVWRTRIAGIVDRLEIDHDKLVSAGSPYNGSPSQDMDPVYQAFSRAKNAITTWCHDNFPEEHYDKTIQMLEALQKLLMNAEALAFANLESKFPDWNDSPGWRQWMAEYQQYFPAAVLDALRRFVESATDALVTLKGSIGTLANQRVALLLGPAGVGKTFAVCDFIQKRVDSAPTVMLHGRWFSGHEDPLRSLPSLLGLPADLSFEDSLALLNAAGLSANDPAVLIIDALNETRPRSIWRNHIERFVGVARRFDNLRLVFTIRTHYVEEVLPDSLTIPTWEHKGFEEVHFKALQEYADFYGLEPPKAPPAQQEYRNPLFLRLLCESLRDNGQSHVDADLSLAEVVTLFLEAKERRISERLDSPRRERITENAVRAIVACMHRDRRSWLDVSEARDITRKVWPGHTREASLLDALISEGLLSEDRITNPKISSEPIDIVAIPFERLSQHLIVREALSEHSTPEELKASFATGQLKDLILPGGELDSGLLDALTIEISETFKVELINLEPPIARSTLLSSLITSLRWRKPESVTSTTKDLFKEALLDASTEFEALSVLAALATKASHPLNADWSAPFFASIPMPDRDAFLLPWAYNCYQPGTDLNHLLQWSQEVDLKGLQKTTARLWASALLWFTASNDRRIRDYATRGVARLMHRYPEIIQSLLNTFLPVDDDWIVERALLAAYGSLLCSHQDTIWRDTAIVIWDKLFSDSEKIPENALIRDYARCILEECSARKILPQEIQEDKYRPPYGAKMPEVWPNVDAYNNADYPKLVRSCLDDDFFHYKIKPCFRKWPGLKPEYLGSWVVHNVISLGYTPRRFGSFDVDLLREYGHLRAKPSYIERVGKKYQWISIARLLGKVADNLSPSLSDYDPPPGPIPDLQGLDLRDLDPTIIIKGHSITPDPQKVPCSRIPDYDWSHQMTISTESWISSEEDVPSVPILLPDPFHTVLFGQYVWRSSNSPDDKFREVWLHVHGLLVPVADVVPLITTFSNRDIAGYGEPRGSEFSNGCFAGEYPFGLAAQEWFRQVDHDGGHVFGNIRAWPAANALSGEYEYDGTNFNRVSTMFPSELFFSPDPRALQWSGNGSWFDRERLVAKNTPAFGRPEELTMDSEWLDCFLKTNDLEVIWIEVVGKVAVSNRLGQFIRSRILKRENSGIVEVAKHSVLR